MTEPEFVCDRCGRDGDRDDCAMGCEHCGLDGVCHDCMAMHHDEGCPEQAAMQKEPS